MYLPTKAAQIQEFSVQFHSIYNSFRKTYAYPMAWVVHFFLLDYSKKIAGLDAYRRAYSIVHLFQFI